MPYIPGRLFFRSRLAVAETEDWIDGAGDQEVYNTAVLADEGVGRGFEGRESGGYCSGH